jgi:hypothetical protein
LAPGKGVPHFGANKEAVPQIGAAGELHGSFASLRMTEHHKSLSSGVAANETVELRPTGQPRALAKSKGRLSPHEHLAYGSNQEGSRLCPLENHSSKSPARRYLVHICTGESALVAACKKNLSERIAKEPEA